MQDRHQRLSEIFAEALEREGSERQSYLDRACAGDKDLRREVEQMLRHHEREEIPATDPAQLVADQLPHILPTPQNPEQEAWRDASEALLQRLAKHTPPRTKHEVKDEIGRGGMGAVFEVVDTNLSRTLAMKVIRAAEQEARTQDAPTDSRTLGLFLQEAQITGQLQHPGIVPVHDLGLDSEGRLFFTMQLVKGSTFSEVIDWVWAERNGWNQTRALGVLVNVLDAMAYAHSKGVIHRDLKPANVMIGRFGETYVLDWGVARIQGESDSRDLRIEADGTRTAIRSEVKDGADPDSPLMTMDGLVVGTPAFMPPEQALGMVEKIDARSDVYAIGAMLYQLLTGQMPYVPRGAKMSSRTVHRLVIQGPPDPVEGINPQVAPELAAICHQAMAREQGDRYASCEEMAEDLRAYLENRVVRAYQTGAIVELKKWVQRNKPLAVSMAALLVVLLASATVVYAKNQDLSASNQALAHATAEVKSQNQDLEQQRNQLSQSNEELTVARRKAEESATEARSAQEVAEAERDNVLRLSAIRDLHELKYRAEALWPVHPDLVPDLEQWLTEASDLIEQLPMHRASLAEARARSATAEGNELPDEVEFESGQDAWWYEALYGLVRDLTEFSSRDDVESVLTSVEGRLERSLTIEQRSIADHEDAWDEAIVAIMDSEHYDGLLLSEQMGLVPLGADPHSELWEFWVVESGERPERDPETGQWVITGETGIVLVLLPGGTFTMGAQKGDPDGPNYDPQTESDATPMEVTLVPFFLSKYELTQGQYLRIMQSRPSRYGPGALGGDDHPVEQVCWTDCHECLRRLGLVLPTEAQWEYGARAGTTSPWWCGEQASSIGEHRAGNLFDARTRAREPLTEGWGKFEVWEDEFVVHAPVGSFTANAFGLHDVIGNVWEWCQDVYDSSPRIPSRPDGLRADDVQDSLKPRVGRGGSFGSTARNARVAGRNRNAPSVLNFLLGLRPARAIDP